MICFLLFVKKQINEASLFLSVLYVLLACPSDSFGDTKETALAIK